MAGIPIGSSFRLTSPQPHLANASFPDAPSRLAQGQLRHVSWRYSQDNPDAHYRINPLAICFLVDGITPAVQFDSWGTLEAHWRIAPVTSDDLPESATPTNKYYTDARAALKLNVASMYTGLGQATDNPMTQLAVSNAFLQLQAPLAVIRPDGTTVYLAGWPQLSDAPAGSQIRIRGNFGNAGTLYITPSYNSIFLEAGAVFTCDRLCPQSADPLSSTSARVVIAGPGTLRGNIIFYNNLIISKLLIQGIRHEGQLLSETNTVNALVADVKLTNVTCLPPAGSPYLYTLARNGATGGCLYFRYRFYQCRIEVSGNSGTTSTYINARPNTVASAFMLSAFNYAANTAQDNSDQANCLLEVMGCALYGDGTSGNAVLATYGGFATYRFAYNTAYGLTAPTAASDPALVLWPASAGSPATGQTITATSATPA